MLTFCAYLFYIYFFKSDIIYLNIYEISAKGERSLQKHENGTSVASTSHEMNKYYEGVAIAFRYAKFITLFITVIFVMVILSFFRDEVSVDNFQYMLKYITSEDSSYITTQKIHYPTADSKALDLFAGDFVSAGSGGISLYDTNGNTVLEIENVFSEPVFSIGKKYGLCYDLSGRSYVIFNTFSKLHSDTLDFPISDAVMTDGGSYAILSKNREYRTLISVFDNDYDYVCTVYDNKYTFDIDMTSKHLAYITAESRDSAFLTDVSILNIKTGENTVVGSYLNEFPVSVRFIGNNLAVITDRSIRFYDSEFKLKNAYSFSLKMPSAYASAAECIMLCFEKNTIGSENEIRFYSGTGELMFSGLLTGKVHSLDINESFAVIHTNDNLYRIDLDDHTVLSVKIETGADKVLLQSDASALVCYKNYAKLVDFKNAKEIYFSYKSQNKDGNK